ncbi:hypothetical protein OPIT5_00325 (plasmid) [Opitutaceae bacterium TAV5]|nr:hypothetical protein OPIT5_00325 [Opitutaceae bacterium TAV5]
MTINAGIWLEAFTEVCSGYLRLVIESTDRFSPLGVILLLATIAGVAVLVYGITEYVWYREPVRIIPHLCGGLIALLSINFLIG